MISEKVVQFGKQQQMFGIVTEPQAASSQNGSASRSDENTDNKPTVLILNAGLVHRVGPYRMAVTLARRLSECGYRVFRFDISSIGDSDGNSGDEDYRARTVKEIGFAQDALAEKYGCDRFVALGLCTGAMNAHVIAVADKRIVGAVLLDAYAYPTMKSLVNRYLSKLRKMLDRTLFKRLSHKLRNSRNSDHEEIAEGIDYWVFPPKEEIEVELQALVKREVELLYIYAGSFEYYYSYPKQLQDNFPSINFQDRLSVNIIKETDHMYTLFQDREILINQITDWLLKKFN